MAFILTVQAATPEHTLVCFRTFAQKMNNIYGFKVMSNIFQVIKFPTSLFLDVHTGHELFWT